MLSKAKLRFLYQERRSCAERSEAYGFNAEQSEARVLYHEERSCAEQSEAKGFNVLGFNIMKNAVVANEVSNGFCYGFNVLYLILFCFRFFYHDRRLCEL